MFDVFKAIPESNNLSVRLRKDSDGDMALEVCTPSGGSYHRGTLCWLKKDGKLYVPTNFLYGNRLLDKFKVDDHGRILVEFGA